MNTTENNKLIAEFMGIVFTKDNKANHPRIKAPYPPIECFKYHSDWNWLMSVVEKIYTTCENFETNTNEDTEWDQLTRSLRDQFYSPKKEDIYNSCLEFIKWYNEQNK